YGAVAMTNLGYVGPRPCPVVAYALQVLQAQAEGNALPPIPQAPDPLHVAKAADYSGSFRAADGTVLVLQSSGDRLTLERDGRSVALYPRGNDSFFADSPDFTQYLLQFGRRSGRVVEAFYGPQWFTSQAYSGPQTFAYPARWNAYVGHYESIDPNGYYGSLRIFVRKGKLVADDGTPLVPISGSLFRFGSDAWTPERIRFDDVVEGRAARARLPGADYYRADTQGP
ncbi:MAG: hypothetical protein M3R35_08700, partial [Candidatus Eremiobacteraeota bacterium]|nr:hypothetical protein [Candidatus Eremiobacteraeota bacterium]